MFSTCITPSEGEEVSLKYFEWIEWGLSALLILLGILCLTLSGMSHLNSSYMTFLHLLLQICLWIAVPILLIEFIYAIFFKKKKKD